MSNKKSLLTESEIRRFMKLANIPAIGKGLVKEEVGVGGSQSTDPQTSRRLGSLAKSEGYNMEEEDEMPAEDDMGGGDVDMGGGDVDMGGGDVDMGGGDASEADLEQLFTLLKKVMKPELADQFDVDAGGGGDMDLEVGDEAGESMETAKGEEEGEEEGDEEEEDEGVMKEEAEEEQEDEGVMKEQAEEEEEEEEEENEGKLKESKLVDVVLSRVTARLIAEAKKKKMSAAEKKKKEDAAKKKKEDMKKKAAAAKKKLEEANAPAPKSTMSNASAAGVAKAAGKADKGTWGVTSSLRKDDSFEKGTSKRGDKMAEVSASAEHIISHGKKNLATQGGNKKK